MNYYISDLHFGHRAIIDLDERPFNDVTEMEWALIDNWNEVVTENDTVYILGDFCWDRRDTKRLISELNGNKVLIVGNHDAEHYTADIRKLFVDIQKQMTITDGDKTVLLSHYPVLDFDGDTDKSVVMLHGHLHKNYGTEENERQIAKRKAENEDYTAQIYNCGCMLSYMNYRPQPLETIITGAEKYRAENF